LGCKGGSLAATTITAKSILAAIFFVNPISFNLVLSFLVLVSNELLDNKCLIIYVLFAFSISTLSPGKTT